MEEPELNEEELELWNALVEEGRRVRAPIQERREREREEKRRAMQVARGMDPSATASWRTRMKGVPDAEVSAAVKRFVIGRAAGMSFAKAAVYAGCAWRDVNMARMRSEEMMCAVEGMEASSRFLMRQKAMSVLEASQDEGVRVSGAQLMMSESILKRLDAPHFGDAVVKEVGASDAPKEIGGGGFVINVISDASKVAGEAPKERPKRALVYTDV